MTMVACNDIMTMVSNDYQATLSDDWAIGVIPGSAQFPGYSRFNRCGRGDGVAHDGKQLQNDASRTTMR